MAKGLTVAEDRNETQGRNETQDEKLDRNWNELLQELRVTQTGVQILAGFLLILPFQARFSQLDSVYRVLYLVAMALATLATCLIIAPVSSHRLLFRQHEKRALVESSSNLAKAGLVAMALAIVTVVVLIFGVVLDLTAGVVAGTIALVLFALFWVVLPMLLLRRGRS